VDPGFNIDRFVEKCPANMSGADFYSITNKARQHALKRLIGIMESGGHVADATDVLLTEQDFDASLLDFQPTLTESAMLTYEKYFNSYSNRDK
jgi:peroxin-6